MLVWKLFPHITTTRTVALVRKTADIHLKLWRQLLKHYPKRNIWIRKSWDTKKVFIWFLLRQTFLLFLPLPLAMCHVSFTLWYLVVFEHAAKYHFLEILTTLNIQLGKKSRSREGFKHITETSLRLTILLYCNLPTLPHYGPATGQIGRLCNGFRPTVDITFVGI